MKVVIRSVVVLWCSVVLGGCSLIRSNVPGGSSLPQVDSGDLIAAGQKLADAKAKADVECAKVAEKQVSWSEERAIGGAISIGVGRSGKGLFVDITEKNAKVLKEKVDKAKDRTVVKLTSSEKNDLNTYVELVGQLVAAGSSRPGIAWTFGVIDNPTPNAASAPGGYVLITTGLLAQMENEAQLAGVLAHEIAHVTQKHAVKSYQAGKVGTCKVAVTGLNLVEAGASNVPGGEDAVKNAGFAKTIKKFADPNGLDLDGDKDAGADFLLWFTDRIIDWNNTWGNAKEDEYEADAIAQGLMGAAGYDSKELEKLLAKISGGGWFAHHPSSSDRIEELQKLRAAGAFGSEGGKAPAFPASVKWPPKPSA